MWTGAITDTLGKTSQQYPHTIGKQEQKWMYYAKSFMPYGSRILVNLPTRM